MSGLRARLLAKVLGSTLVFATLAEAAEYRKYLVQVKLAFTVLAWPSHCAKLISSLQHCFNLASSACC